MITTYWIMYYCGTELSYLQCDDVVLASQRAHRIQILLCIDSKAIPLRGCQVFKLCRNENCQFHDMRQIC